MVPLWMSEQGSRRAARTYTARVVALALACVVTGKLGLMLAPSDGFASKQFAPARWQAAPHERFTLPV